MRRFLLASLFVVISSAASAQYRSVYDEADPYAPQVSGESDPAGVLIAIALVIGACVAWERLEKWERPRRPGQ